MEAKPSLLNDHGKDPNVTLIPEHIEDKRRDYDGRISVQRYTRGKLLGKGGFARCFVGTLSPGKSNCALKIVSKTTLAKSKAAAKVSCSSTFFTM